MSSRGLFLSTGKHKHAQRHKALATGILKAKKRQHRAHLKTIDQSLAAGWFFQLPAYQKKPHSQEVDCGATGF
jgi:hypothetical protein